MATACSPECCATLSGWVFLAAGLLDRVARAVDDRLMKGAWLQADDTGFPVQGGTDGNLRKGRLWAVTDQQEVRYHFSATKAGKNPVEFLKDYQGRLLLVDGGSEFNAAVEAKGLLRAGRWSHLRTYFFHARHHHPEAALLAIGTIRDLFAVEEAIRDASLEDRRARGRGEMVFGEWIRWQDEAVLGTPKSVHTDRGEARSRTSKPHVLTGPSPEREVQRPPPA